MFINGKQKILVISPQSWDGLKVSKHHFATELAELGNQVYFLNPPTQGGLPGRFETRRITAGLSVVDHRLTIPRRLLRWSNAVHDSAIAWHIRRLTKKVTGDLDVVWDFDSTTELYTDHSIFGDPFTIFHPVDRHPQKTRPRRGMNMLLSVAECILNEYPTQHIPRHVLSHGLCRPFDRLAARLTATGLQRPSGDTAVGYFGNLCLPAMDVETMQFVISQHPKTHFEFFGPTQVRVAGREGARLLEWVKYLKQQSNVTLHGMCTQDEIIARSKHLHAWIVCYDRDRDRNNGANSHKITEYLATGKPVISSVIDSYQDQPELVRMAEEPTTPSFAACFEQTVNNLTELYSSDLVSFRLAYARQHSYASLVRRIGTMCDGSVVKLPAANAA